MVFIYTWNTKARLRKLSPFGIPFNSELMTKRKKDFMKYHPSRQPLSREFHCRHIIRIIFFSTCLAVYLLGSAGYGMLVPWKALWGWKHISLVAHAWRCTMMSSSSDPAAILTNCLPSLVHVSQTSLDQLKNKWSDDAAVTQYLHHMIYRLGKLMQLFTLSTVHK